ncbi:hypothetical protein E2C01_018366 [Portunus trituberculatus]|uniref:Uncharacterized protein n=1 Tax=Portunus trituberculatus TaxID=210409 RepID=A0A5B7DUA5_PORTR|nr:hypothetical protein [Portunus trituberculatus]
MSDSGRKGTRESPAAGCDSEGLDQTTPRHGLRQSHPLRRQQLVEAATPRHQPSLHHSTTLLCNHVHLSGSLPCPFMRTASHALSNQPSTPPSPSHLGGSGEVLHFRGGALLTTAALEWSKASRSEAKTPQSEQGRSAHMRHLCTMSITLNKPSSPRCPRKLYLRVAGALPTRPVLLCLALTACCPPSQRWATPRAVTLALQEAPPAADCSLTATLTHFSHIH